MYRRLEAIWWDQSWRFQSVEPLVGRRADNDEVDRAVGVDSLRRRNPIGCAQVGVLLQAKTRRGRGPGNGHGVCRCEPDAQELVRRPFARR